MKVYLSKNAKSKEQIDAEKYYTDELEKVNEHIEKLKSKEFRFLGTIFVTFNDTYPIKQAIKDFKQYQKKQATHKLDKRVGIKEWLVE